MRSWQPGSHVRHGSTSCSIRACCPTTSVSGPCALRSLNSDPYMRIAAVVGLQDPSAAVIPQSEWPAVRDALIGRLDDPEAAIRNRASVTLAGRAGPGDGPALGAAPVHEEQVRNLLIACIRADAQHVVLTLLPRLLARVRMDDESRTYLERWQADGRRPPDEPPVGFMLPGLGYIANLDG